MTGSNNFIPFNGLSRQYLNLRDELAEENHRVLSSGQVLNGPYIKSFENEIAKRCNRKYAIAVNSCTSGIHYIMDYIQHKSFIIKQSYPHIAIPNFSFRATRSTVIDRGRVMTLDVDKHTGILNPALISESDPIDILMYVNLYGNMIDYSELSTIIALFSNNKDTVIIEDAAQSFGGSRHGQPSGSFGDFSVLSFDPTKNLPNYGSGGMILTDDKNAYDALYNYVRNTPINDSNNLEMMTYTVNSRMSEVDCASMIVKLDHFDKWQERRNDIADYYNDNLSDKFEKPHDNIHGDTIHAWHKYVILTDSRDKIEQALLDEKISAKIHYKETLGSGRGAASIASRCISLPIYPELTDAEVERIVKVCNR